MNSTKVLPTLVLMVLGMVAGSWLGLTRQDAAHDPDHMDTGLAEKTAAATSFGAPAATARDITSGFAVRRIANFLDSPIFVTHAPGDTDRLFIVLRGGRVLIMDLTDDSISPTAFLDITSAISTSGEGGLFSIAFHPNYFGTGTGRGLIYACYTNDDVTLETRVSEFAVTGDPATSTDVDESSERMVMRFTQYKSNHNGGWIGFGPNDGFLYIASGDGGGGNDELNAGQDLNTFFAKILRIDPTGADAYPGDDDLNYAIPASNPFVGETGLDEIWAYGLRNPWRCGFDRDNGDLYIGDVGQDAREEIDYQHASSGGGENYGWRLREGSIQTPSVGGSAPADNVEPVYDYRSTKVGGGDEDFKGRSVTGGYVYRGPVTALVGRYIFADYLTNRVWSIRVDRDTQQLVPNSLTDLTAAFQPLGGFSLSKICSFGEDANGNLYAISLNGAIFRVTDPVPFGEDEDDIDGDGIPNDIDPDMDGDGLKNEKDSDRDGDGWDNNLETANGTDGSVFGDAPSVALGANSDADLDADDIPDEVEDFVGMDLGPFPVLQLPLTKVQIKLNLAKANKDVISLKGLIPIQDNLDLDGQECIVSVGGAIFEFLLDEAGKGVDGNASIHVKPPRGNKAPNGSFILTCKKSDFAAELADEEIDGAADAKNEDRDIHICMIFNGTLHRSFKRLLYSSRAGRNAKARHAKP